MRAISPTASGAYVTYRDSVIRAVVVMIREEVVTLGLWRFVYGGAQLGIGDA